MKEQEVQANFKGLLPFLCFILLYLGTGIFLECRGVDLAFYQLPGPVAAFAAVVLAFLLFKGSIEEKFQSFLEGCGHPDIMTMCIIYLLAGAFAGLAKAMGGVDATVNLGLHYIPPHFIAVGIFCIGAFISTATGSSVGSIVALGPIAVGLGEKSSLPLALLLAALLGGAMFGDNLSIISDTTIAATKTQGVAMKDKFRINLFIAAPAAIITLILLLVFGQPEQIPEAMGESYNVLKVLPYLFVLLMALLGINVFVVLTAGIFLCGILGFAYGDFSLLGFSQEIFKGFSSMTDIFLLSLLTGGMAHMVSKEGGLQWLIEKIHKGIQGKKTAKLGMGLLVALTDIAVANNTVAILINGSIAKEISTSYEVDPRESAAFLDIFSCIFQGLLPYGAQMLILLSFAQELVEPLEIIALLWYPLALALCSILYILVPGISSMVLDFLDKED